MIPPPVKKAMLLRCCKLTMSLVGGLFLISTPVTGYSSYTKPVYMSLESGAKKVFVAGSTGRTGSRVVKQLVASDVEVVAAVRESSLAKARELFSSSGSSVQVEVVDLENSAAVAKAMDGCDAVVCALGALESEALNWRAPYQVDGKLTQNIIKAATKVPDSVKHFVLVTSLGTAKFGLPASVLNLFWGVLTWKRQSEVALINSGLPYTIVRPGGMERPTDTYEETHNLRLAPADSLFGGQVSRLQVAKLVSAALLNPLSATSKIVEAVAEDDAPKIEPVELLNAISKEISDSEWKARLSREQYYVLRQAGTERPWTSPLNDEKRQGIYTPEGVAAAAAAAAGGRPGRRGRALSGAAATLKNLVVPILFSDHADRDLPSQDDLDQLWNAPGGHPSWEAYANQSVKEFYYEQSYGGLALESTVLGWIEIDSTEEECANGDSGTGNAWMDCLREALETADVSIDFEDFDQDGDGYIDAIAFMHSGYGAEYGGYDTYGAYYTDRIWSHKWAIFDVDNYAWDPFTSDEGVVVFEYHVETALYGTSGSQVTSIGVAAHETGHFLGLPDLYDTDYSSAGISTWGVMANSWGWDGTGGNPPSFSAWSKYALGWVEPTELEESGSYTISDIQSNADVYMVSNAYPDGEYLLIENRQAKGADKDSPQGGLLVWHIDEYWSGNTYEGYPGQNGWPENGYHYLTALLQADGDFELEKGSSPDAYDVFHSGGVSALSADTGDYPSSMAYQGGTVYSTGFELADISASGDSMTFSAVVGNSTTGSSGSSDPTSGLTLEMFDSWGDGWNGNYLGLYAMDDEGAGALNTFTLLTGAEGEAKVAVANGTCYSWMASAPLGTWQSEVSWSLPACGIDGDMYTTSYFCIDDVGNCAEYVHDCDYNLTLSMMDSWGDGWSGNVFGLFDKEDSSNVQNATMYSGFSKTECLNVEPSQCYTFQLAKEGTWQDEMSWSIGNGEIQGYAHTAYSFCIGDDGSVTSDNPSGLTLSMFDSWGDGWNGNSLGLFSLEDPAADAISTYTLYSGSEGEEIVVVQNSTCYSMYVETVGSWGSEVSWEICDIEGGIDTTAYFCIDDVGSCSEYVHDCNFNLTMHKFDSWGDGWNGNIISLYDDSDEAIQNVTLYGGFSGVECLDVELSQCYSLKLSEEGSWPEEITWAVEGVVDNAHSQTEVSFCLDDGGQITVDYPNGLTLTMFDSWGDGWNGNSFGLFAMDDEGAGAISTYTLYSGSEGEEIVVVQNSTCYSMYVEALGAYGSEVSWEICGIEGGIETTAYFCIDDVGSCSEYVHDCDLKMDMYDSWGDGWNGNTISLYDDSDEVVQEVTLYGGFSGVECLDVEVGQCYSVKLSEEGSYAEEVTFSINGIVNDANYQSEVSFCVDNSTSPPEYSTGGNQYGVAFSMFDSWGDGWNGNFFGLFSLEDPAADAISTHTLSSGYEGEETVVVETSACYSMYVVAVGSWGSEVSWEICGIEGGIETTAYFCIDDVGSCSEYVHECDLKMEMYDSWGDGWNGNIISLYGDSDEVVQEVTLYGGFSGVECLDVELGQCYSLKLSEEGSWPEELTWAVEGVVYNATAESEVSFCTDESETAESSDEYSVEISMCLVVSTEDLSASACSSAVHSVITDFLYATDGLSGGETLILTMTAVDGDACSRRALKDAALSFKASSSTQKPSTTAGSAATEDDGTLAYDINIKIVVDSEAAAETFAEAFQDEVDEGALEDALAEEDLTVEQLSATATAKGTSGGASSSSDNDGDSSTTATLSSSDGETETSSSEDVDAVTTESESESEDTTESEEDEETLAGDMAGAARLLLARRGAGVFLVALAAVVGVAVVLPF